MKKCSVAAFIAILCVGCTTYYPTQTSTKIINERRLKAYNEARHFHLPQEAVFFGIRLYDTIDNYLVKYKGPDEKSLHLKYTQNIPDSFFPIQILLTDDNGQINAITFIRTFDDVGSASSFFDILAEEFRKKYSPVFDTGSTKEVDRIYAIRVVETKDQWIEEAIQHMKYHNESLKSFYTHYHSIIRGINFGIISLDNQWGVMINYESHDYYTTQESRKEQIKKQLQL